jgi:hypothetical protein
MGLGSILSHMPSSVKLTGENLPAPAGPQTSASSVEPSGGFWHGLKRCSVGQVSTPLSLFVSHCQYKPALRKRFNNEWRLLYWS